MAKSKALICPYCGDTQPVAERCRACGGLFEPLSRQATHNEMGPWFIRDGNRPFQPGCSYETLIKLIERGQVTKFTILKGPTTKQFWTIARRVPGVSHLLGYCHNCDASVDVGDHGCHACGVPFGAYLDRNYLGLPEIRPMPWEASHEEEERRQEASSRSMDFRRAAEPLGISSFASDEELRGGSYASATFPAGGGPGAARFGNSGATTAAQGFADPRMGSGFIAAQGDNAPAARAAFSTSREFARQRRLVRVLTVGLILMVGVAGVAVAMMLRSPDDWIKKPTAAAPQVETPPAPKQGDSAATSTDQASESAAPAQEEPPPAQEAIDVDALVAQAQEQIAIAEDENNTFDQRSAAYQEALRLLKKVDDGASSEQRPTDLADRIKNIERAANDLRLKAYFP